MSTQAEAARNPEVDLADRIALLRIAACAHGPIVETPSPFESVPVVMLLKNADVRLTIGATLKSPNTRHHPPFEAGGVTQTPEKDTLCRWSCSEFPRSASRLFWSLAYGTSKMASGM